MDMKLLLDAVGQLGLPVALATVLIWHFIRHSRLQESRNNLLMVELSKLREAVEKALHGHQQNERLLQQNEKLVEAIRKRESTSFDLVRQVLELRAETDGAADTLAGPDAERCHDEQ